MIIQLSGGLGNQMFQYAFGKALELSRKEKVYYDISAFVNPRFQKGTTRRFYELDIFFKQLPTADQTLLYRIIQPEKKYGFYLYRFLLSAKLLNPLTEKSPFLVDKDLLHSIGKHSIVQGYFQTEDYFKKYEPEIRKAFTFKRELSPNSEKYAATIKKINAVSLHIRRGDYINNKRVYKYHGVCSEEYYRNAIAYMKERVADPTFFIFSDDLEWVQKQPLFHNVSSVFVSGNKDGKSYEDMRLMSLCKHHIIANSTFSWWGAWLNSSKTKIVIAPQQWFQTKDSGNLIPGNWVKL